MATSEHPATPSGPAAGSDGTPSGPRRETPRENLGQRRIGRAAFVGVVGLGIGTLFAGGALSRVTKKITQPVLDSVGLAKIIPSSGWRIYTVAATMPTFDEASWRLTVDGLVDKPLSLSLADLRDLPRADQVSTFHCVTGWIVNGVRWGGVRIDDVLKHARPQAGATALTFTSSEQPYTDSLTRAQASLPDVLLAYEMDGGPLPRAHGAPLRLVIPDMYGYKNVKWLERITLAPEADAGYWEVRGYDRDAWVGKSNGL